MGGAGVGAFKTGFHEKFPNFCAMTTCARLAEIYGIAAQGVAPGGCQIVDALRLPKNATENFATNEKIRPLNVEKEGKLG